MKPRPAQQRQVWIVDGSQRALSGRGQRTRNTSSWPSCQKRREPSTACEFSLVGGPVPWLFLFRSAPSSTELRGRAAPLRLWVASISMKLRAYNSGTCVPVFSIAAASLPGTHLWPLQLASNVHWRRRLRLRRRQWLCSWPRPRLRFRGWRWPRSLLRGAQRRC